MTSPQTTLSFLNDDQFESKIIWRSIAAAFLAEAFILLVAGWRMNLFHHNVSKVSDESQFIQAEMVQMPPVAHLVDQSKPVSVAHHHEVALSKNPSRGRKAKPNEKLLDEKNQTEGGPQYGPTHGPIALYTPAPVIPSYLQDDYLKASVVIEFMISSTGAATPRLIDSSSNDQLDAIALETVEKWKFRPAEKNHMPIDSKVRLRIEFEVQ